MALVTRRFRDLTACKAISGPRAGFTQTKLRITAKSEIEGLTQRENEEAKKSVICQKPSLEEGRA